MTFEPPRLTAPSKPLRPCTNYSRRIRSAHALTSRPPTTKLPRQRLLHLPLPLHPLLAGHRTALCCPRWCPRTPTSVHPGILGFLCLLRLDTLQALQPVHSVQVPVLGGHGFQVGFHWEAFPVSTPTKRASEGVTKRWREVGTIYPYTGTRRNYS